MTTPDAAFRFTQEDHVAVLLLLPELNNVQWGEIDSLGTHVLEVLESRPAPNVIVDLSPLNYMGSAMVALIVRVWKATTARKGKLSVVCPHPMVKEVLKLASLDKHWAIVETQDEARAALGVSRSLPKHRAGGTESSSRMAWWAAIPVVLAIGVGIGVYITNSRMETVNEANRGNVTQQETNGTAPVQSLLDSGEAALPSTSDAPASEFAEPTPEDSAPAKPEDKKPATETPVPAATPAPAAETETPAGNE